MRLVDTIRTDLWRVMVRLGRLVRKSGLIEPFVQALWNLALRLLVAPSEDTQAHLNDNIVLTVPAWLLHAKLYCLGEYEPGVAEVIRRTLRPGMTFVDLGANIGYHTVLASKMVGPTGKVYAFEPDHRPRAYLTKNIALNGCVNVVLVGSAVSSAPGYLPFVVDPGGMLSHLEYIADRGTSLVRTVTLDGFFEQEGWPNVDLMKIDIEGSEQAALEGARQLVRRNPGLRLVVEYTPQWLRRAGSSPEALAGILKELGFPRGFVIERGMRTFSVGRMSPSWGHCNLLLTQERFDIPFRNR